MYVHVYACIYACLYFFECERVRVCICVSVRPYVCLLYTCASASEPAREREGKRKCERLRENKTVHESKNGRARQEAWKQV